MKGFSNFLVEKRIWLFVISILLAVACGVLSLFVTVNEDLTQYLPKDSNMRVGLDIMEKEFSGVNQLQSFKVMFENLTTEQKNAVQTKMQTYETITLVDHDAQSPEYNKENYTLFVLTTTLSNAKEITALMDKITADLEQDYTVYSYYQNTQKGVLGILLPVALSLFLLVLILLSKSYIEVVLLLAGIGVSIVMNTGSNIVFPSISDMTLSIAAVLQLVLSIDYSIMMFHRYQQERALLNGTDNVQAMKNAVKNAFGSITGSAFTTIAGLLVLLLMSFTIGTDMGLVMAKGILCSLLCVFTVMPTLILWCDRLLTTTNKEYLRAKRKSKKEAKNNA